MSLFMRERLYVALTPEQIVIARTRGLFSRQITATSVIPLAEGAGHDPAVIAGALAEISEATARHDARIDGNLNAPSCRSELVRETMRQPSPNHHSRTSSLLQPHSEMGAYTSRRGGGLVSRFINNTRVTIRISDQLVRYFIVHPPKGINNLREIDQLVRLRFEALFGQSAEQWTISTSLDLDQRSFLACAVQTPLLDALNGFFVGKRCRVESIQPHLVSEFNACRHKLQSHSCWFAVSEPDSVTLALLAQGAWQSVRTYALDDDLLDQLPNLVSRERLQHELADGCDRIFLAGDIDADLTATEIDGLKLTFLPSSSGAAW